MEEKTQVLMEASQMRNLLYCLSLDIFCSLVLREDVSTVFLTGCQILSKVMGKRKLPQNMSSGAISAKSNAVWVNCVCSHCMEDEVKPISICNSLYLSLSYMLKEKW